ncbi:hypothetical protein OIDMADRAFT_126850 [Oidiodendron maius Zn]|uniref:Aminotransferase class V domain-containing protein n=1 Tax=Oidiodendron maius (strain Zn) TaxID=913774 RepID=A0A0C3GTI1_OIDMZ|nr:hypothetical protein OIDMADRAFT_126850 [Oidiodendron maius Zn]
METFHRIQSLVDSATNDTLPSSASIVRALDSLPTTLPSTGLGEEATKTHLLTDLVPAFNGPKTSANYYGFVTGGVLPIAEFADHLVTAFDQNVQVHLPAQSISTVVEHRALDALVELLDLGHGWEGKTFTTGATAANILGLACGRQLVVQKHLASGEPGVGEIGLLAACVKAGIREIQVLTAMGHSSLYKAASVIGLGRDSVKDIGSGKQEPWRIDIDILERELRREGVASIVVLSAGEVNTGRFSTNSLSEMLKIRELCEMHKAWLHVDGAFGIFARSLASSPEFADLSKSLSGIELADSIAGDAHKMLNVPYDCGFFLTRSSSVLFSVFQNPNAAYLSSGPTSIPSPLNIGLENSRRFRALPVYAVLMAYGREGLAEMFARQVRLARRISQFLHNSPSYTLLVREQTPTTLLQFSHTHIIVLFSAKDDSINSDLVGRINATRKMYVSGTKWDGRPACRIAISTWKVNVERDLKLVTEVLQQVLKASA